MWNANYDINPFDTPVRKSTPPAKKSYTPEKKSPAQEEREHLHTVNDVYKFLQNYLDLLRHKLERDGKDNKNTSRLNLLIQKVKNTCTGEYSCDPYKYEPLLLNLLGEAKATNTSPEKINELRSLIRAGSWMTYERMKPAAVVGLIDKLKNLETETRNFWLRQADPDTYKELEQDRKETLSELDQVTMTLQQNKIGQDLEASAGTIEDFNTKAWSTLRTLIDQHQIDQHSMRSHPLAGPLIKEIEMIRPVRDLIYFRRVYPKWAEETIKGYRHA